MSKIGKLLKNRKSGRLIGGVACLAAASLIFALGSGIGARAEDLTLGDVVIAEKGGIYKIATAEELVALGNATASDTNGKTFQLACDITIPSVTEAATGAFAGTFDGMGHVIKYENIDIKSESSAATSDSSIQGLLFGSVEDGETLDDGTVTTEGTVKNLIIHIADTDAKYSRKSKNVVQPKGEPVIEFEENQNSPSDSEEIHTLVMSDASNITGPDENGIYKQIVRENGTKTVHYAADTAGSDYFGLICGNNQGSIEQVYITGNTITIEREELEASNFSYTVQPGYRTETYQYQRELEMSESAKETQTLSIDGTAYVEHQTYQDSFADDELLLTVTAPTYAELGSKIIYTVNVQNHGSKAYDQITIHANRAGTWNVGTSKRYVEANQKIELGALDAGGVINDDLWFECDSAGIGTHVYTSFVLDGSNGIGENITRSANVALYGVKTEIFDRNLEEKANEGNTQKGITLNISAPKAIVKGETAKYEVTVTNTSDRDYEKVILTSSIQGKWNLGTAESEDASSFEFPLSAKKSEKIIFSYTPEMKEKLTFTTGGSATLSGNVILPEVPEVSAECKEIELILLGSENKNNSTAGLEFELKAPIALKNTNSQEKLKYEVVIKNTSARDFSNINISTSTKVNWENSNHAADEYTIGSLSAGSSKTVNFEMKSEEAAELNVTVSGTSNGGTATASSVSATIEGISSRVFETISNYVEETFNNGLYAKLSIDASGIFASEQWNYTLTLKNTNDVPSGTVISKDIVIENDLSDWSGNVEFLNSKKIPAGDTVVLTRTVTPNVPDGELSVTDTQSIVLEAFLNTSSYRYRNITDFDNYCSEFIESEESQEPVKEGNAIVQGNYLYAGGVAGKNFGSIEEIKQSVNLIGAVNDEFMMGGITGEFHAGTMEDIYMTGLVNDTSNYTGAGAVSPSTSTTTPPSSVLKEGTWSSYTIYEYESETNDENSNAEVKDYYDLNWLIKNGSEFSIGTLNNNEIKVSIVNPVRNSENYEYIAAYQARKSMEQTSEDTIHASSSIQLGKSAFYGLKHVYATDGYYHYNMDEVTNPEVVFPYEQDTSVNPFATKDNFEWEIGIDKITAILPDKGNNDSYANTDRLYYSANIPEISEDGVASLPITPVDNETYFEGSIKYRDESNIRKFYVELLFGIPEIRYGVTPYISGHIYPMIVSDDFGPVLRGALSAPEITTFDFYDKNNEENPKLLIKKDGSYEETSIWDLNISKDISVYSPVFSYAFLETEPNGENWKSVEGKDYLWENSSENSVNIDVQECDGESIALPDVTEEKTYYLYMKVESKYHTTIWYCYGPFSIVPKGTIDQCVYGINSQDEAYRIPQNEKVVEGDYLFLTAKNQELLSDSIQYLLSSKKITNFSGYTWQSLNENEAITLKRIGETDKQLYVYARCFAPAGNDTKYGEISSWAYEFVSDCAYVKANPYTISYSDGESYDMDAASVLSYSSYVQLATSTEDAVIYYVESEKPFKNSMTIERAESIPQADENGAYPDGYYQNGKRWYYISADDIPAVIYPGGEGISVLNKTSSTKELYLSTAALSENNNPGQTLNYAYRVGEQQQVSPPESAMTTTTIINGKETEGTRADVSKGAVIYFTSMTPNAEIYYWLDDKAEGEGTLYDSNAGVKVTGTGATYTITLVAKETPDDDGNTTLLDSNYVTFIYNITSAEHTDAPTATPSTSEEDPTVVLAGEKILLSSPTTGAVIYYALNGDAPVLKENPETGEYVLETGEVYKAEEGIKMPEGDNGFFIISAVAVKPGLSPSSVVHFTYSYPSSVQAPYANVNAGNVAMNTEVILKNRTQDATIYYTVGYGKEEPEMPTINSGVFDEANPFVITKATTIKAIAVKDGVSSDVITLKYKPYEQLDVPKASIESGSVISGGTILNLSAEKGSTIYYTTDGSDPIEVGNAAVMTGTSIILNGKSGDQITIKAYAAAEDMSNSEVVTFTYQFSQNSGGVTADVESGSLVSNGSKVNLMTDVTDAEIYYTTNGESPVTDGIKGTTVTIDGIPGSNYTVKAVAVLNGTPGTVVTFTYKIKAVPNAPSASPAGGVLTVATRVELSSNVESIYYTTDGTTPTKSSTPYTEPILINRTTVLKAVAVSEDGEISEVRTFVYTAADKASDVISSEADGTVLEPGTVVTLSTNLKGAQIYYSTNGTEPTVDNLDDMLLYDNHGIEVNRSVTIHAVAYRADLRLSNVATWNYIVETIPAVEQKKAEAAKLEEEGLRDTDASDLVRNSEESEMDGSVRTLSERKYAAKIIYAQDSMPNRISFEAMKEDKDPFVVLKTKQLFGEENTVLESYLFKVKAGTSNVQPKSEIEIAVPIPNGYEDAVLTLAYVDSDKNLTTLQTRRENDMLYGTAEKIGDYIVVGPERTEKDVENMPYLLILMAAAGSTMLFGLGFLIHVQIKKYHGRKKNYPNE